MSTTHLLLSFAAASLFLSACKKDETTDPLTTADPTANILVDFSSNVAQDIYADLATKTLAFQQSVAQFQGSLTTGDLDAARNAWRTARQAWEQSEGHLFGPVATLNYDPRMDTWPVNYVDLEAILANGDPIDQAYVSGLEDALKGFHPAEYLLWGADGAKVPGAFTAREFEYLNALCVDLVLLTTGVSDAWDPNDADGFFHAFSDAGNGSVEYATRRSAFEELVNGMSGICDEVAAGKIGEPFLAQDPSLEESPFAKNSITDFTNNIRGVENVYMGRYIADGSGLEDLVRAHDLSLDGLIKQRIATAIAALGNITLPFGEAIIDQPVQVQAAIDAINDLEATISGDLMALVQLHVTD